MPELPEVETVRRGLKDFILRKKIKQVEVLCEKSFVGKPMLGEVCEVRRFGKALVIDLDNGYSLMIHLRMTGQLIYRSSTQYSPSSASADALLSRRTESTPPSAAPASLDMNYLEKNFAGGHPSENFVSMLPNRQTRVVLEFEGGTLYFNDQRKFGFIKVLPTAEVGEDAFIRKLAKEPWEMTGEELYKKLQRHSKALVKAVILDQTVICGLGNIYADEALYAARVHPARRAGSLSLVEAERLLLAAREVMEESIEAGGSTMRNYVKADGTRGNYLDLFAKVYHLDGKPCERCGVEIKKIKVGGRGTHFCPKCQKLEGLSR